MADDGQPVFNDKLSVILIAMGSASFVVTIYHLFAICCYQRHHNTNQQDSSEQAQSIQEGASNSVSNLIPAYKYRKKNGEANGEDDTCAVCLGDFEEGEELRTLPECMHTFHLTCIDMWLSSHSSCPVCRADATPSPAVPRQLPESGSVELNAHHSINMVQMVLEQNGFVRRY